MKIKALGWVLLFVGGIGAIIGSGIRSDWPMYAGIILSSSGAVLILCSTQRIHKTPDSQGQR